ncbi:hypothetical protein KUCAC02_025706, partial [Chaenocephalus aceratus]
DLRPGVCLLMCIPLRFSYSSQRLQSLRRKPNGCEVDPVPTHTHVEIFKTLEKFSWLFSGNPTWQSSKALCRHFVWRKGVFWVRPNKDASLHGPTTSIGFLPSTPTTMMNVPKLHSIKAK